MGSFIPFHLWHYSSFWSLTSLRRRLHSSLFSVHLFHPRIPRISDVFLRTTSSHLVLGFPTGLVLWNFLLRTFSGIPSPSILQIWPAHPSLLMLTSSTTFRSWHKLQISLFHLGRRRPLSCIGPYILFHIYPSNAHSMCCVICVTVQVTLPQHSTGLTAVLHNLILLFRWMGNFMPRIFLHREKSPR